MYFRGRRRRRLRIFTSTTTWWCNWSRWSAHWAQTLHPGYWLNLFGLGPGRRVTIGAVYSTDDATLRSTVPVVWWEVSVVILSSDPLFGLTVSGDARAVSLRPYRPGLKYSSDLVVPVGHPPLNHMPSYQTIIRNFCDYERPGRDTWTRKITTLGIFSRDSYVKRSLLVSFSVPPLNRICASLLLVCAISARNIPTGNVSNLIPRVHVYVLFNSL